jgi:hypothetical protein
MVRAKTDKPADDGAPKKVKSKKKFFLLYSDTFETWS